MPKIAAITLNARGLASRRAFRDLLSECLKFKDTYRLAAICLWHYVVHVLFCSRLIMIYVVDTSKQHVSCLIRDS